MRKRLTNNLGLKLMSIFAAALLWLLVVNVDDPIRQKTFGPIPVEILNESAITGAGKVYHVLDETDSVYVTYRGNRSVIEKLEASDFTATADMKDLIFLETVPITVTPTKNANKIELISAPRTLRVQIEDAETKQFAVTVTKKGIPADGYAVGSLSANPNIVKITGPASIVKKVSQVRVELNVENMREDGEYELEAKLYDSDGDALDASRISFSNRRIKVSVDISETKSVGFGLEITGEAAEGYRYTGYSIEPSTVVVAGSASALDDIKEIKIPSELININGATTSIEQVVDIRGYLPDNVWLVDDTYASVLVTIEIQQLDAKTVTIPLESIGVFNVPNNLDYEFSNGEGIPVTIRGLSGDLENMNEQLITASIDLVNLAPGTHELPASITLPSEFQVIGEVFVTINLKDRTNGTIETPPSGETGGNTTGGTNTTGNTTGGTNNTGETEQDTETPGTGTTGEEGTGTNGRSGARGTSSPTARN